MKNNKLFNIFFTIVLLSSIVLAGIIATTSNGLTTATFWLSEDGNISNSFSVAKYFNVTSATLNISGDSSYMVKIGDDININNNFGGCNNGGLAYDSSDNTIWVPCGRSSGTQYATHLDLEGNNLSDMFTLDEMGEALRMDFDSSDNSFWLSDLTNSNLVHYDSSGVFVEALDISGVLGGLTLGKGLAFDSRDNSFWIVANNNRILHANSVGSNTTGSFTTSSGTVIIQGLDFDSDENILIMYDKSRNNVIKIDFSGNELGSGFGMSGSTDDGISLNKNNFSLFGKQSFKFQKYQEPRQNGTWIEVGTPDGVYEWDDLLPGGVEFNSSNNITNDFSSAINNVTPSCLPDINGNCLIDLLFHSDSIGRLSYSGINITYDDLSPSFEKNTTEPTSPIYLIPFQIITDINLDTLYFDDIIQVGFNLTAPNGSIILEIGNGTNDNLTHWNSTSYISGATSEELGIYSVDILITTNASYNISNSFTFEILDTTKPIIVSVDSPINNTLFTTTSDIDVNISSTDDVEIDSWWIELINTTGELLEANTTPILCNTNICGVNLSQHPFPVELSYDIYIWINDTSNNLASTVLNISTNLDTSIPIIPKSELPSGEKTTAEVFFSFNITDNVDASENLIINYNITDSNNIVQKNVLATNGIINDSFIGITGQSYIFRIDAEDVAGNIANESSEFNINIPTPTPPSGGGGGSTPTVQQSNLCNTSGVFWQAGINGVATQSDLLVAKNSERNSRIIITNEMEETTISLECKEIEENPLVKVCDYVTLSENEVLLPSTMLKPKTIDVIIKLPDDIPKESFFNIEISDEVCSAAVQYKLKESATGKLFASFGGEQFKINRVIVGVLCALVIGVILWFLFRKLPVANVFFPVIGGMLTFAIIVFLI